MSKDLVFNSGSVPAHIKNRKTSLGKTNLTASLRFNKLSFDKNLFTYIQAGMEPKRSGKDYCDCVIIHAADTEHRVYFDGPFDRANPQPPVCFSGNGKAPHADAKEKQHPRSCQLCEKNQKGSGLDGKSKACKYTYPVVLLPLDADGIILPHPFVANINASSLFGENDEKGNRFNLVQYNTHLEAQKVPTSLIVTRMTFDLEAEGNSKVLFQFERFLDEEEIDNIEAAVEDKEKFPLKAMVSVTQSFDAGDEADEEELKETEKGSEELPEKEVEEAPVVKSKKKTTATKKTTAKKSGKTTDAGPPVSDEELNDTGLDFDV